MEKMQVQPGFALSIDGTNDTGLEKMNPLTVRIYKTSSKQVHINFWTHVLPLDKVQEQLKAFFKNQ